jgi:hypothetical protein
MTKLNFTCLREDLDLEHIAKEASKIKGVTSVIVGDSEDYDLSVFHENAKKEVIKLQMHQELSF